MRHKGVIVLLTIVITLLCLYNLSFTFKARRVQQQAVIHATDKNGSIHLTKKQAYLDSMWELPVYHLLGAEYTYKEVKEKELSLGLDLQGGMHIVLEISPVEIIAGLSVNDRDPILVAALKEASSRQKVSKESFVDLFYNAFKKADPNGNLASLFISNANKDSTVFLRDDDVILKFLKGEVDKALARSFTIINTRVNQFGTSEAKVQRLQNTGRIQIEIPGTENPQRVRKLLQGVARLEFWDIVEYYDPQLYSALWKINLMLLSEHKIDLPSTSPKLTVSIPNATISNDSTGHLLDSLGRISRSPLFMLTDEDNRFLYDVKDTAAVNSFLKREDVKGLMPVNIGWLWDVKPSPDLTPGIDDLHLIFINLGETRKPMLSGDVINGARVDYDHFARPAVRMTMTPLGSKVWGKITATAAAKNPQGRVAIVLDNYVYTAPTVQSEIPNGNSQITGSFTLEEAKDLALVLRTGSLPSSTKIVEEAIVGPSLGHEAQYQGLLSLACGLVLVAIFMIVYYAKGGLIAVVALLFNIFFVLGILAEFSSTLTLPGIAGIVLTIGMAVDANVLIYERIREELKRGSKLKEAIRKGYERTFSAILDANVATFFTAFFLYIFGQGPLKGFAIVLMIGIATSFFSAVYVSRVIIEWWVSNGRALSFETRLTWSVGKNSNYDFIGNRRRAYMFSFIFILGGIILVAIQGFNLGVDFTGGRSFIVSFAKPVQASEMKASLTSIFRESSTEIKNYGGNNVLRITTSHLIDDNTESADENVKSSLIKGIEKATNKNFVQSDQPLDDDHFTIASSSKVGATVADDIRRSSAIAGILAILSIFVYILIRFRKWQFSMGAIVALLHDGLFTIAAFAIARALGFSLEIDQIFVAALLTVIGYSISDTVVIFDRIREYVAMGTSQKSERIFNNAINNTLSRTLITSATVLMGVTVLFVFGGVELKGFSFALLIGVLIGTYSSIFIASPLVIDLGGREFERSKPRI